MIYLAGGYPAVMPLQTPSVRLHTDRAAWASVAFQGPRHSDHDVLRGRPPAPARASVHRPAPAWSLSTPGSPSCLGLLPPRPLPLSLCAT